MTPNPKSICQTATVREAAAFLSTCGIGSAPVVDDADRPVGVVSAIDIVNHFGQGAASQPGAPGRGPGRGEPPPREGAGQTAAGGAVSVRDTMTRAVFCVRPDTAAGNVIKKMLGWNLRRLFVVNEAASLTGGISSFDVLRRFGCPEARYRQVGGPSGPE
jgi:CBS domain-containing protein